MNLSENNEIMDCDVKDNMNESIYIDENDDVSLLSLSKKVDKLQEDIDKILILLHTDVKGNCDKMSDHIDFIDNVYNKVKYPMDYVVDKINNTRSMLPSV
tara:strand:+ start:922 stop:1221 length:300 start_codon:yes stop_codon:yes gene_type:complete